MVSLIPGFEYDIFFSYSQKMLAKYNAENERVQKWLEEQGMLEIT
jgi:hypothetical protein